VTEVPYVPHEAARPERRPLLGYAMVGSFGILAGVNGSLAKVALESGLSSLRLAEIRCLGGFVAIGLIVLATQRENFRVRRDELRFLIPFGVAFAVVQCLYFLAIQRLEIGVALLIQFISPLLVALWARFVVKEPVRRRLWVALAMALIGLSLVVDVYRGVSLDGLGIMFAALSGVVYAAYLLLADKQLDHRGPTSLLCYGFLIATIFWSIVQPWWSFPTGTIGEDVSLLGHLSAWHLPVWALVLLIIGIGTVAPFLLLVGSLRHIPPSHVAIGAMSEPVAASIVAWAWLGQTLGAAQIAGGAVVLAGIGLAQTARPRPPTRPSS
jgi:drug/metabolite transporter (DMT)-like permease